MNLLINALFSFDKVKHSWNTPSGPAGGEGLMLQFQDIGEVCAGGVRELSTADGAMDGHICLRRV